MERTATAADATAPAAAAPSPHGAPPHEASPHGAPPHGASPHGASPHGASPHGASPHGASPHGASPHGASPHGASPHEASPHGASPRGAPQESTLEVWSGASYDACPPDVSGLLDALPRQRGPQADTPAGTPADTPAAAAVTPAAPAPVARRLRPWRLPPAPAGTPFTFGYAAVLAVTSLIADHADPSVVHTLHQASSTDVAHLLRTPVLVLTASALWIAGGLLSPYAIGFLFVLTALERRIGGARTACVFLLGHVLATLATEGAVGAGVLVGLLPDSSLHRLDYGVSFGVATGAGALAGLLAPWLRWPLLALFGGMLLSALLAYTDPMTNWGHLLSFAIGIALWPSVRRWRRPRRRAAAGPAPCGRFS